MNFPKIIAIFAFLLVLIVPATTYATTHAFFGLGGRVLNTTICAIPAGAVLVEIVTPNRGVQEYLWTPTTIRYLYPGIPTPGQKVILLAAPTPIPCTGVGLLGPKVGAGFPIVLLLHGSSLY